MNPMHGEMPWVEYKVSGRWFLPISNARTQELQVFSQERCQGFKENLCNAGILSNMSGMRNRRPRSDM